MKITSLTRKIRKALPLRYCGAVIVAAGTASRMGGIDKVMAPLRGEPMILRTARTFQNCDAIREIVIVTREDLVLPIIGLCAGLDKVKAVVVGGADRPERGIPAGIFLSAVGIEREFCESRGAGTCPAFAGVFGAALRKGNPAGAEPLLGPAVFLPGMGCRGRLCLCLLRGNAGDGRPDSSEIVVKKTDSMAVSLFW